MIGHARDAWRGNWGEWALSDARRLIVVEAGVAEDGRATLEVTGEPRRDTLAQGRPTAAAKLASGVDLHVASDVVLHEHNV